MLISLFLSCYIKNSSLSQDTKILAHRGDVIEEIHGTPVPDPYRWLERESKQRDLWVNERNAEFERFVQYQPQFGWLKKHLREAWEHQTWSHPKICPLFPSKQVDWVFQDKTWTLVLQEGNRATPLLSTDNLFRDEDILSYHPSPDCSRIAFLTVSDTEKSIWIWMGDGERVQKVPLSAREPNSLHWNFDGTGFFYSGWPKEKDGVPFEDSSFHRTWFHRILDGSGEDELVAYDDADAQNFHSIRASDDGGYLIKNRYSFSGNRLWIRKKGEDAPFQSINLTQEYNHQIEMAQGRLFIRTNWNAPNYKVMTATVDRPGQEHWKELIPEGTEILRSIELLSGRLAVQYQQNASAGIRIYSTQGTLLQEVPLPKYGTASIQGSFLSSISYLSFSSFTQPKQLFLYDARQNQLSLYRGRSSKALVNVDVQQVFYPSSDGVRISMFVLRPKGSLGDIPFLLTGYGGFNVSMLPKYSDLYTLWIQSGGGVAIPNLRGGGEYGEHWHQAGMREKKQATFDDFIAAAQFLIEHGHTNPEILGIAGGSNGGLLVSAVTTQKPELFKAVLCMSPLTDMIRFHRYGLAKIWAKEYGTSANQRDFEYLLRYSPYHNVREGVDYPAMLFLTAYNDPLVEPMHAMKMAASIRWANVDSDFDEPVYLSVRKSGGHGDEASFDELLARYVQGYGFLMTQIGLPIE